MSTFYATYPPNISGTGVPTYSTLSAFPSAASAGNGALAIALDTDTLYISNGTIWEVIGGPGVALSIGTFDSEGSPSANALTISTNALIAQSADATHPGMVNTSTQTFAGVKTFNSNPIMSGLTASQAVVTDASKALASLAYTTTSTATTLAERDGNANLVCNNIVTSSASIVSAAGTTNLTPGSSRVQILTGTTTQTFKLPNANTLPQSGTTFEFNNNSTGILTVQDFSSGTVCTIPAGGYARVICTDTSSSAGFWDKHFLIPANGSYGTAGMTVTGTFAATSTVTGTQLVSTISTGTAPLTVSSTTKVSNLYVDRAALADTVTTNANLTGDVTSVGNATTYNNALPVGKGGTGATSVGNLTEATSSVLTISGGTSAVIGTGTSIQVKQANTTTSGYLSSTDWNTFNNKGSGSVTSVGLSVPATSIFGATGTPVTTSGTLGLTTTGTSGGIPYFSSTSALSSSAALTASQLVLGGGAGSAPTSLAAGSQYQVLTMGASNPGYGAVNLAQSAAVTGTLPGANVQTATTGNAGVITLKAPTISLLTSGTAATYTVPAGVLYLVAELIGGGGGGGGGGLNSGPPTAGGAGGNTTFVGTTGTTSLTAGGGSGGGVIGNPGGNGGTNSVTAATVYVNMAGSSGQAGMGSVAGTDALGGSGGCSPFGGAGGGNNENNAGKDALSNSGSGAGAGGSSGASATSGAGGGSGGYLKVLLTTLPVSYTYTIGAAGTHGNGATNGQAGGTGGTGCIRIWEYYY